MHPNQITQWRSQLLEGATAVFGENAKVDAGPAIDVKEDDDRQVHELPLAGQAKALGISRAAFTIWPDRPRTPIWP